MHSLAPVMSTTVSGGAWFGVPLPAYFTAFSLKFLHSMTPCPAGSGTPTSLCFVFDDSPSACGSQRFTYNFGTKMLIAAPDRDGAVCPSNATLRYFVPSGAAQGLDYTSQLSGGDPATMVQTERGILHLEEWHASPPSLPPSARSSSRTRARR